MAHFLKRNLKPLLMIALFAFLPLVFLLNACEESQAGTGTNYVNSSNTIEAGKYLVTIGGCNDCHTVGYMESNGKLPQDEWLTGSPVGLKGPWGTTYASNLRLVVDKYSEADFLKMCRTRQAMPPMPWPSLNNMSDKDLTAIYQFIKSLGVKGVAAPSIVGPGVEPTTPYIIFEPLHMERLSRAAN